MTLKRLFSSNAYCGAMLTVIAGSLLLGCLQRAGVTRVLPSAEAQGDMWLPRTLDVRIVGVSPFEQIPVKLVGVELNNPLDSVLLPVSLQEIKRGTGMLGVGARWDSVKCIASDKQ